MDDREYLAGELGKMGLDKREADTYLQLLEIDAATASQVAQMLGLSRPTVYRVLENLISKELVSKIKENRRTFFTASSPDRFLRILKVQRRRAEEQEREFLRIISVLQTKYHLLSDKNEIKVYTGNKEKKLLMDDLSTTQAGKIKVIFSSTSLGEIKLLESIYEKIRKRKGSIKVRELYPKAVPNSSLNYVERRVAKNMPALPSDVLIITDKIFLLEKKRGFCVERKKIVHWFKFLFGVLWEL